MRVAVRLQHQEEGALRGNTEGQAALLPSGQGTAADAVQVGGHVGKHGPEQVGEQHGRAVRRAGR